MTIRRQTPRSLHVRITNLKSGISPVIGRPDLAELVAWGIYHRLIRACWKQGTDRLGAPEDIAGTVGWHDDPVLLVRLLREAHLLSTAHGITFCPTAVNEIPCRFRESWTPEERKAATARAKSVIMELREPYRRKRRQKTDASPIFSLPYVPPEPHHKILSPQPEHYVDAEQRWDELYHQKYGRSAMHDSLQRAFLSQLLEKHDARLVFSAMRRYIQSEHPKHLGHDLRYLLEFVRETPNRGRAPARTSRRAGGAK